MSFADSLKNATVESTNSVSTTSTQSENIVMTTYSTDDVSLFSEDEWLKPNNANLYDYYDNEYYDDKTSIVDTSKNITLSTEQINLTQEKNSQYIPFQIPRYYDGFDLSTTELSFYWVHENGNGGTALPVDVYYNTNNVRFAWLVDDDVTALKGKISFEIHAEGENSKGLRYLWKTKPNNGLNVLQALEIKKFIEPDETWQANFIQKLSEQADRAENAKTEAINAANEAKQVAADLQDGIEAEVQQAIGDNYYTKNDIDSNFYNKSEVDAAIQNVEVDLTGYATETYVDEAIDKIPQPDLSSYALKTELPIIPTKVSAFENDAGYLTEHQNLSAYALKSEVPSIEGLATETYVDEAIAAADLDNYYKKSETYSSTEIDEKLDNVSVDLSGYYTKTEVDAKDEILSSSIGTNTSNISSLSATVTNIQSELSKVDTSPRLTYDTTYDDESKFTLWEIENEGQDNEVRTAKSQHTIIGGGGGGGSTSSTLKIEYITKTPLVATVNDKIIIQYRFSGIDSSGDEVMEGNYTWKVGNTIVATGIAVSGENSFDITKHISIGTQKVVLSIADDAGSLVTKSWTIQKVDVKIESSFNDKLTYPMDAISFDYTPYGSIAKTIHFILDNVELGTVSTTASGIPMSYSLPIQTHGSHLLETYITAEINGNTIESNHIYKDIIWWDESSDIPVIGCTQQQIVAKQYDTINIQYTVYDPKTETPTVTLSVDDNVISTQVLNSNTSIWQFKSSDIGDHTLSIQCRDVVKTLHLTIEKLDINVEPITANLVFDFNPTGKTNNDVDRLWTDGTTSMTVSDNFDWVNGGYQIDDNGDQYFCIKAGTSAFIDYKLFADDAKKNGKEFKLIFKTTNVKNPNATFLSCIDNTTESNHIGIRMDVHEAYIYAQAGNLFLPYSEEDVIEFEFNISKNTEAIPMIMGYEDGVSTSPLVYDDSYSFTQNTPKIISLGSNDCDLYIYRFKVYNSSLTPVGILNNFISDARNAEEMISRYERNQIYNENNELIPEILAKKCPQLRIIKIEAPYFTNNKNDKVPNTTIECIYKGGDQILDNWIAYNCQHSGQGTSSNNYGASGRNLDLIMNKSGLDGIKPRIVLSDGTEVSKVSLTRNSIENNYFNVKVNIASSENANNALLQRRYNTYNPYARPFIREDQAEIPKIKDTMEFYNCVVFIKESDTDLSTHREFADNQWHYYAFGNIGDSKKTDNTRLTDTSDKYEFCVEIMDVELPNSSFPGDSEGIANLEKDPFDESMTYGLRYIWEKGTDEENAEVLEFAKNKWKEFYKFVVNSTDEEFHNQLGDYFVIDSALYYYLFTTRYTMVDNRCKNSFWHYGKTGDVGSDGNPIRKWDLSWDYDNDTALGINNYGDMVYRYGFEDTDVDEKGEEIFRCSNSTFFCRIRDLFSNELKAMYNTLESQGAWHGESLINQFDEWQNQFPEELWRIDIERKYIRTYNSSFINGAGDSQFLNNMAHGKKKYQRRQFERSQEKYMASKYQSSVASSDNAVLRCTVPSGNLAVVPNYKLKLTPYAYMYLNVKYGTNEPIQVKAEPNIEYEIPFTGNSADIVDIYSSSLLTSLGDLSSCYAATIDTSKAKKLKKLIIGNKTEGYDNPYLTTLTLGANYLLEELNIENVSGLTQSLNLSELSNLSRLYACGSNVGGVTFADGGRVEIAELPAVNAITMKNLIYLSNIYVSSYDKLATFRVENCNTIDILSIINSSPNLNRVRIIGVNWNLENTSILERLYRLYGIDNAGYNVDKSVLSGSAYVPVIRQKLLADYNEAWTDLTISYDTLITQFTVTFQNDDGTILDIQYVDKGSKPVDPITRSENPIPTPTKASTVSTDFTYHGWDSELISVFSNQVITATYSETTRVYTAKYVSKGVTLQETTAPYGTTIFYEGDIPTYTAEESAYKYHLFQRWDKSGYVDGDKIINAVFDTCEYSAGYFDNKDLSDMRPVEIYALTKVGMESSVVESMDSFSFTMGNDYSYDDIESHTLIDSSTSFVGNNYIDTGISVMDKDRDFVLAIDFEFGESNANNATLMQCFKSDGSDGFKLMYLNTPKIQWGSSSTQCATGTNREMLVLRHIKGDNNLYVYTSNLSGNDISYVELQRTKSTITNSTLVFGCVKADDGSYENYATGTIYWAKLWYTDLGDVACRNLASYIHENISVQMCGFKRKYLSDGSGKRSSMSFLASHILRTKKYMANSYENTGGWATSTLNTWLNTRFYNGLPIEIKQLIKQVKVNSSVGGQSTEITASNCYIYIPAYIELYPSITSEPYINEDTGIDYMVSSSDRVRTDRNGNASEYWTRSPNKEYTSYYYYVQSNGNVSGFGQPYGTEYGVVIEFSI